MKDWTQSDFIHDVDMKRIIIGASLQTDREKAAMGVGLSFHTAYHLAAESRRRSLSRDEVKTIEDMNWALRTLGQEELKFNKP